MFSIRKHQDVEADKYTSSLDFGSQLTDLPEDTSVTLWGPGVKVKESPASILSHSLHVWRKESAHLPAAEAAEELNNLYENLPPELAQEALDLTFRDMIARNSSPKCKKGNVGKNLESPTKGNNAANEEVVKNFGQVLNDSEERKDIGLKNFMAAKIAGMLSPKAVFSSSKKGLSHEELEKLVEKRRGTSRSSNREGLYSASSTPRSTPLSSFRRVSPLASPTLSPSASQKLSPTPAFTDYMLRIDRHSFERELVRSARFLESFLDDSGGMPPVNEDVPPQKRSSFELQYPRLKSLGLDEDECSTCSRANLFFSKTTCLVCGKNYCPSCKNVETKEVRGVRRCKTDCSAQLSGAHGVKDQRHDDMKHPRRKLAACWPFGSCKRVDIVEHATDKQSYRR